jgi:hypothetical protein
MLKTRNAVAVLKKKRPKNVACVKDWHLRSKSDNVESKKRMNVED